MTQRRIDQEIVRATDELKTDVALTHQIVTGDENTVIEVSPGNRVRSPKKMVEDTYQETQAEIEERFGSLEDAVNEATEQATRSEQSRQASDSSAANAGASEQEAAASEASAGTSETNSRQSELNASESEQAAAGSASAAQASAEQAKEHQQSAAASDESAQSANQSAQSAKTQAVEAKDEAIDARDLARRWATEEEETPIEGDEYSALHWAKVAERIASTLTNGMYFAGSWDLAEGFPPEPDSELVPWYRLINTDVSTVMPVSADLENIARQSNKGDQLIWDPIKKEWFVIDTSDEVWLVNGKKGNVVLSARDVEAFSDEGGDLPGHINVTGVSDRQYRITHPSSGYMGEFAATTNAVIIRRRDSEGNNRSIGVLNNGDAVAYDGSWRRIYHENFKPSPSDIGAVPEGYGLAQDSLESIDSVDELNQSATGWFRATTDTPGNPTGGSGYAIENIAYNSPTEHFIQLAFRQSSMADLYIRSHNADGWTEWFQFYSTRFKPTATDVGLGNLTNHRQVILNGNNRIQNASSFIIDGNETPGDEDNVRGVVRITLSEDDSFGAKGTVFFQAGHAESVNTANNGAMVFGGYWGGMLHEVNFKLLNATKLTVMVSGSSTRHSVYHEGNKPSASDVGAVPVSGGVDVTGTLAIKDGTNYHYLGVFRGEASARLAVTSNQEYARLLYQDESVDRSVNVGKAPFDVRYLNGNAYRGQFPVSRVDARDLVTDGVIEDHDLNLLTLEGTYSMSGTWKNTHNGDIQLTALCRVMERRFNAGARIYQELIVAGGTNTVYTRTGTGDPVSWSDWSQIFHEGNLAADRRRKITISTSDPSGGSDGDIWFKVE